MDRRRRGKQLTQVKGIHEKHLLPGAILLSIAIVTLQACGAVVDGTNMSTGSDAISASSSTSSGSTTVSYSADIQPIWDAECVSCHASDASQFYLDLTSDVSYDAIINVASPRTTNGQLLVLPGDSANSVMYMRTSGEGLDDTDNVMPPSVGLGSSDNELIKSWIDAGAENN